MSNTKPDFSRDPERVQLAQVLSDAWADYHERGLARVSCRHSDRAVAGDGKSSLIQRKGVDLNRARGLPRMVILAGPRFGDLGRNGQLRGTRQGPQTASGSIEGHRQLNQRKECGSRRR